jgi:glycosyltransferase involved in cell wall biosynthesis
VQRSLKLAKYLPQEGWLPTVITVDPRRASYPEHDSTLAAEIPDGLVVRRTPSWDPYAAYARLLGKRREESIGVSFVGTAPGSPRERVARWIRANLFIPDARVGWVPFARRAALRELKSGEYEAVVTTGPPHSTHFVGRTLRRRLGLRWIADMRDPWTGIHHYDQFPTTAPARVLDRHMERSVLRSADRVTVVSPSMAMQLGRIVARPYDIVTNGFDPDDFRAAEVVPAGPQFVIRHVGNLSSTQVPEALWSALRDMSAELRGLLRVELVGNVDASVLESAIRCGIEECIDVLPYVDHREAVRLMRTSHALLLVINRVPQAASIVTGKIFEYVASGRPVLGVGIPDGDAGKILSEARAGEMIDHQDDAGVGAFLTHLISEWQAGRASHGAPTESAERYGRDRQAAQLARILDEITENRAE